VLLSQFFDLFFDLIHFTSLLTDYDTGSGSVNCNDNSFQRALDHYTGNSAFWNTSIDISPDLVVFYQFLGKIITAIPVGVPSSDDPKSKSYRIYFLSHIIRL